MSSHIYQLKFHPDLSDRPGELIILFNSNTDLDFNAFTYMVTTHLFQPIKTINFLEVDKQQGFFCFCF
jgi:hypothetical protein